MGAFVVFEPSGIKDERLFLQCLGVANVVKYASDRISGTDGLIARAKVPVEIETMGADGLRFRVRGSTRGGKWNTLPAYPVTNLADAAGSGDWTTAGLIHSLAASNRLDAATEADSKTLAFAIRYGQALAALNCHFAGARGLMYAANAALVMRLANAIAEGVMDANSGAIQAVENVLGANRVHPYAAMQPSEAPRQSRQCITVRATRHSEPAQAVLA